MVLIGNTNLLNQGPKTNAFYKGECFCRRCCCSPSSNVNFHLPNGLFVNYVLLSIYNIYLCSFKLLLNVFLTVLSTTDVFHMVSSFQARGRNLRHRYFKTKVENKTITWLLDSSQVPLKHFTIHSGNFPVHPNTLCGPKTFKTSIFREFDPKCQSSSSSACS